MVEPSVADLPAIDAALRRWQRADAALQLHPGDVGWFRRFGAAATASALRVWTRHDEVRAVGLLDGPEVLRVAFAPEAERDEDLAHEVAAEPDVAIEAPTTAVLHELLPAAGWRHGEQWVPLRLDLADPVAEVDVRIEVVDTVLADSWTSVTAAAFGTTPVPERWHTMSDVPEFADCRCLLAVDGAGEAVASVAVWSAGPRRPGLLEPMGVHPDHRGRGHGRAIVLAAAAALRDLGSASADVCTRRANVGGVATYLAAGFAELPARCDLERR